MSEIGMKRGEPGKKCSGQRTSGLIDDGLTGAVSGCLFCFRSPRTYLRIGSIRIYVTLYHVHYAINPGINMCQLVRINQITISDNIA